MSFIGDLSVCQLIAYYTLITVFKVQSTGKPRYIDQRLPFNSYNVQFRGRSRRVDVKPQPDMARGGLIYEVGFSRTNFPKILDPKRVFRYLRNFHEHGSSSIYRLADLIKNHLYISN